MLAIRMDLFGCLRFAQGTAPYRLPEHDFLSILLRSAMANPLLTYPIPKSYCPIIVMRSTND